jgi:tRNA (guanine-N7-)-methyltransferase
MDSTPSVNPTDYIITRKRKKYRFALFHNNPLCFEVEEWTDQTPARVIEVGAGTGLFSVALAEADPDKEIVAIDVKADRLQTGARKAIEEQLKNLRFLRARGGQLDELFLPHSIEEIWVTFPDPFPKDRMAKHRLTHPDFLEIYEGLLAPGGALYFKTDALALFQWSLEQFVREGWRIEELSFELHESVLSDIYKLKTTYETRYMNEGIPINFVKVTPPVIES